MSQEKKQKRLAKREDDGSLSPSRFTGSIFGYFFRRAALVIFTLVTLTLAYPALMCWYMRWEVKHTVIQGRRLTFDGYSRQLYGKFLLWLLLSIISVSIYFFVKMKINLIKWQTKHTHVEGFKEDRSKFSGAWYFYWGHILLVLLVTILTIGLLHFWGKCHMERWMAKHTIVDDYKLSFDGLAKQYFGRWLLGWFLTIITLFIYYLWKALDIKKWIAKHTIFLLEHEREKERQEHSEQASQK